MKLSTDMKRRFDIIKVLRNSKPTLKELQERTGIPKSTIKRQIASMRVELGIKVLFIRETGGAPGAAGYYVLDDWGIIDEGKFLSHYSQLLPED